MPALGLAHIMVVLRMMFPVELITAGLFRLALRERMLEGAKHCWAIRGMEAPLETFMLAAVSGRWEAGGGTREKFQNLMVELLFTVLLPMAE